MDFIRDLNASSYGGFSDWRMPTVKELQSIVDYSCYSPSINIKYFPNTVANFKDWYLSSTIYTGKPDSAFIINFDYGDVGWGFMTNGCVRAVRSGRCQCIDNDGDGYGEYCPAGMDCNDVDPFYNETCPDCEVNVIPKALGWFMGEEEKTRRLLVIGNRDTVLDEKTPVRWETSFIEVLSKRVFFKRFMFMKVSIDGATLNKGEHRVLIGNCSGKLTLVK